MRVKEVVSAALVCRGLLNHRHAGRLRDPHFLLHVIPPLAVITETERMRDVSLAGHFGDVALHSCKQFVNNMLRSARNSLYSGKIILPAATDLCAKN